MMYQTIQMNSLLVVFLTALPFYAFGFVTSKSTTSCSSTIKSNLSPMSSVLYDTASPHVIQENSPRNINGDRDVTGTVDRAPCFDGICDSQPIDDQHGISDNSHVGTEIGYASTDSNKNAGGATLRLGTMTGPTVWSEFGRISQEHDVANLGQGEFSFKINIELNCILIDSLMNHCNR